MYGSTDSVSSAKAQRWLDNHQLIYQFVDLDKKQLTREEVAELCHLENVYVERLFIVWSTAFKKIQSDFSSNGEEQLLLLCKKHHHLLRRPLIIIDDVLFVGYNERLLEELILQD